MISVPNLRRLLNGNNLILIFCLLLCIGCGSNKKTVKRTKTVRKTTRVTKPKTTKRDSKVIKKDTTDWGNDPKEKEKEVLQLQR